MPGAMVRVMRYQYQQGDRRLVPAGTAQTDDKGSYRVWGLNPGDYYVSAVTRIDLGIGGGGGRGAAGTRRSRRTRCGRRYRERGRRRARRERRRAARRSGRRSGPADRTRRRTFPASASINEARPVTVGVSQEVLDIDFSLQLVRTSRVSGHVDNPDGTRPSGGNVNLTPRGSGGRARQPRHQLRIANRLGRQLHHQQRAARPLHAARAQQRQRRAAVRVAAALGRAAAISPTLASCWQTGGIRERNGAFEPRRRRCRAI